MNAKLDFNKLLQKHKNDLLCVGADVLEFAVNNSLKQYNLTPTNSDPVVQKQIDTIKDIITLNPGLAEQPETLTNFINNIFNRMGMPNLKLVTNVEDTSGTSDYAKSKDSSKHTRHYLGR